jgi:spore germination protein KB
MPLEPGRISGAQAVYTIVIAVSGTASLIAASDSIAAARQDAWVAPIISGLITLISGYLWLRVAQRFPGRTLFEWAPAVMGRFMGGILNVFLLTWVGIVLITATAYGVDLVLTSFLPNTPRAVLVASFLIPAAYVAYSQLETVGRICQLTFWLLLGAIIAMVPLAARDADLGRLLPVGTDGITGLPSATFSVLRYAFENFMLVAILPFTRKPRRPVRLLVILTALIASIQVLLTAWSIALFGPIMPGHYQNMALLVPYIISVGEIFDRLDPFFTIVWGVAIVAKVAFWYWAFCLGLAQVFGLEEYRPLAWPLTLPLSALTVGLVRSQQELSIVADAEGLLLMPLAAFGLPVLLLVVAALRSWAGRVRA